MKPSFASCLPISAIALATWCIGCTSEGPDDDPSGSKGGVGGSAAGSKNGTGGSPGSGGSSGNAGGGAPGSGGSGGTGTNEGGSASIAPGSCEETGYEIADLPAVGTEGIDYLSDLQEAVGATNGLGPIEKDMSNGMVGAADGGPLVIAGICYPKGLGVRAWSEVTYDLDGQYAHFISDSGWDYELGTQAGIHEVYLDDALVYDPSEHALPDNMTNKPIDIDVTGKNKMKIVYRDGFDDVTQCFGVWGGARLVK